MNNTSIKIATLNVKGLNNPEKRLRTLTLLKSYRLDIILLQETNIFNTATQQFLKTSGLLIQFRQAEQQ
jgi:exonuclease III